ncbi:glycoside hydrolase family 28 protein [Flavicella marina]|uniref:glycoside hydrolase family 28 protein n=1 Tax=Flavicella marina TaxID=1475951 RepID=UPI001264D051|nr:glycosyl hydrolase family 28 protein [Flavicella marina]
MRIFRGCICVAAFFTMFAIGCSKKEPKINVVAMGAVGDQKTLNTVVFQEAIDSCSNRGGGVVFVPKGVYVIGTILLKDNVTLELSENATLLGSEHFEDYINIDPFTDATGQVRGNCLVGARDVQNISIIGKGTIDGNGGKFTPESYKKRKVKLKGQKNANRPFLIRIVRSSNVKLQNIRIQQSGAWAVHLYQSKDVFLEDLNIYNHCNKNNDGIDLDSSHDIFINNCKINTEDDAICIKATSSLPTYNVKVRNCWLKSDWGAIKFGTESMGDFYKIDIQDCFIRDTKGGGIKLLSVDGSNMHDVVINNITMENVDMPIFIRLGERLRTYRNAEKRIVGSIKNVKISNVKATTMGLDEARVSPPSGVFITGTPNYKIEQISLENIEITLPGGSDGIAGQIKENVKMYPEYTFFNVLPAYGIFARHIENLDLKNVVFLLESKDARKEMIFQDVARKTIK